MRHKFLLSAPVLALLLTLTTLLAACSSDDPTATPTRPPANDPTPTQPDPTATPTPSEPRVIRYAVASFGETQPLIVTEGETIRFLVKVPATAAGWMRAGV